MTARLPPEEPTRRFPPKRPVATERAVVQTAPEATLWAEVLDRLGFGVHGLVAALQDSVEALEQRVEVLEQQQP